MKTQNFYGTKLQIGSCFLVLCFILSACERRSDHDDLSHADSSWLIVQASVNEAEEETLPSPLNAESSVGATKSSLTKVGHDEKKNNGVYIEGDGFDAITSVTDEWKGGALHQESDHQASASRTARAATPMSVGTKYRLVLYKEVGGTQTFWRQKQLTSSASAAVDTTQQIEVVRGDTYRWYAYSYNNSNDIPPIANTGTNVQVTTGVNSDFLYATGTISISAAGTPNTPLAIVFRHQVARLAVEIDARGMFADEIRQLGISVGGLTGGSPLTSGMFGLLNGQITSPTPYTPNTTFMITNFENVDAGFNDRKAIYFYSATPASFSNLSVTLSNVTIAMDDAVTVRTFSGLNTVFPFAVTGMQAGRTYNAKIDLIESPLTVGTTRWARTNLYLHPTKSRNPYRFHATYAHTNMRTSYFPFRSITPYMFGTDGDPCAQVHPTTRPSDGLSVWRQPTGAEFSSLGTSGPLGSTGPSSSVVYGVLDGRGYYEYAATGTAAPYPSSNLRFNMNGFGTSLGVVNGLITIQTTPNNYGTEVRNWSSDRLLELGGLLGLGAYGFRATRAVLVTTYNSITPNVLETLTISTLGAGLLESSFQNVRCVRR